MNLSRLLEEKRILVCCGSGGVGKTTTAAAIAIRAAMQGRRTLVLTIDPARRLANALLIPVLRTDHTYYDAQVDGWQMIEDYLGSHSGELSLPSDASAPLDAVSHEVLHHLRIQSGLCELIGIGQSFGECLTLASPDEHCRVDELLKCLTRHRASVEFLGLTLQSLTERVELPEGEATLLAGLLMARLGPLAPDEPLAPRLPRGRRGSVASPEP